MSKIWLANNKVIQISPGVILGESSGSGSAYAITYSVVSNGSFSGVNAALPGDTIEVEYSPNTGYMLDYITVNGVAIQGNTFTMPNEDVTIAGVFKVVDYNPLNLPADTLRAKFLDGYTPTSYASDVTFTQVSSSPNVWDVYKAGGDWSYLLGTSSVIEVLGANSSNVTNMSYMFSNCNKLSKVALFDTSNVTNMEYMLNSCNTLVEVPLFDTSNVTNMSYMLAQCSNLTKVPLFDTSSAANMSYMFSYCASLTSIPLFDTSSATNMDRMFMNCTSLHNVNLTIHGSANYVFQGCSTLKDATIDATSATSISYMCQNCISLEEVTIVNPLALTNASYAFANSNLRHLNISDTSAITNVNYMFRYCYYLDNALEIYTKLSTQATPPTSHNGTFSQAGERSGNDQRSQIPSSWGGTGA